MGLLGSFKRFCDDFLTPFRIVNKNRQLTLEMVKRDITDRYAGQILGVFWVVGHPLVLIGVYIFIFTFVFKTRVNSANMSSDYTMYLLSGLIPWLCFQESMTKGCIVISSNASLVKQIVFPIEILPVKSVFASLITMLLYISLLILYVLFFHGFLFWTYLLLPLVILMQCLTMVGINYIFSSIGAYFRDLKDLVQVLSFIGIYLMPVFYLPESVPNLFRPILFLNPFSYFIWVYQDVIFSGKIEHWWAWIVILIFSILIFTFGYRIFKKIKGVLGNIL